MLLNVSANRFKDAIASGIKIENRTSQSESTEVRTISSVSLLHHLESTHFEWFLSLSCFCGHFSPIYNGYNNETNLPVINVKNVYVCETFETVPIL